MKRKAVLTGALAILLTAAASATNWRLYNSCPAPAPNVRGFAYGTPCYVLTDGSPPRIWPFYYFNFGPPIHLDIPRGGWGLGRFIGGFWVSNYNNSYIYKVNMTGSVLSSFRCPRDHPAEIAAIFVSYGDMAVAIPGDNVVLYLTSTGSIVRTVVGPGKRVTAYHPWGGILAGDTQTGKVYTYAGTTNVSAVAGISPGNWPMSAPYSNFFVTDMATNTVQGWVWAAIQPVAPASFGRVKALFR
ncbi:MAG: hypothetical protein V3W11_10355 [bacterium]